MIGRTLAHYRILQLLGRGGMGEVYLAEDAKLQRHVALKVLPPDLSADPSRRERLEREARAVAALNHPHIVTIYSVDETDGVAYLTLEYIDGQTLASMIPAGGLTLERLLALAIPVADAVGAAHQRGITHRDLKPTNVMVTSDARVKVLDFGLARVRQREWTPDQTGIATLRDSTDGQLVGTVAYMSPEQADGKPADPRSDVFALGIMLYEMATGERPFHGDSLVSMLSSILKDMPAPVTATRRDLPSDFGRIVHRCLEKDPDNRYQTATDLRNDLRALVEVTPALTPAPAPRAPALGRRAAFAAAALLLITLLVGWTAWTGRLSLLGRPAGSGAFASATVHPLGFDAWEVAVSPDGRLIAYDEKDHSCRIWIRQIDVPAATKIIDEEDTFCTQFTFNADASALYYHSGDFVSGTIYKVALPVGGRQVIAEHAKTGPILSPDGSGLVFFESIAGPDATNMQIPARLTIGRTDGTGLRPLVAGPLLVSRSNTPMSWAPDGRRVIVGVHPEAQQEIRLLVIDVSSGAQRELQTPGLRGIRSVRWLPDHSLLVSAAGDTATHQIWRVNEDGTGATRITDGTGLFDSRVSLSRDGRLAMTRRVQEQSTFESFTIGERTPRRLTGQQPRTLRGVHALAIGNDGQIALTAARNGSVEIVLTDADGSNQRQLTRAAGNAIAPLFHADGRTLLFHAGPRDALWQIELDGRNQRQVVNNGRADSVATSPDGRWAYYCELWPSGLTVRRVSIDRGDDSTVFDSASAAWPPGVRAPSQSVVANYGMPKPSPDGRWLLLPYEPGGGGIVAVAMDGAKRVVRWPLFTVYQGFGNVRWAHDSSGIVIATSAVGRFDREPGIWFLPIDGGAPRHLMPARGEVIDYAISPDGQKGVVLSRTELAEIVRITLGDTTSTSSR